MIRATGWTVLEYWEQPAAEVFDLLENIVDEPPAHVILAWRYLGPKQKKLSPDQIAEQQAELAGILGQGAKPMPDHIRDALRWAEDLNTKVKG